jgi:hypothetical protein
VLKHCKQPKTYLFLLSWFFPKNEVIRPLDGQIFADIYPTFGLKDSILSLFPFYIMYIYILKQNFIEL